MNVDLKRALSANVVGSFIGIAMQALMAPLFLWLVQIDQFSTWVLATAISSYISLGLNGLFYATMNDIVMMATRDQRQHAEEVYTTGTVLVGVISFVSFLVLAAHYLWHPSGRSSDYSDTIYLAIVMSMLNLSYVLYDANFRVMGKYALGFNLLTVSRFLDWGLMFVFLYFTRNISTSLMYVLLYKAVTLPLFYVLLGRLPEALWFRLPHDIAGTFGRLCRASKGQFLLSSTTAAATNFPQIVMSTIFLDMIAVQYNTYRTYLRLTAAVVVVLTSASWPLMSRMYAQGQIAHLEGYMRKMMKYAMGLALVMGIVLVAVAVPAFRILFHGKVQVDFVDMCIMLVSVTAACGTTVQQSLYQSTNHTSGNLVVGLVVTVATLLAMSVGGYVFGFRSALVMQSLCDVGMLVVTYSGVRGTLALRRQATKGV